MKEEAALPDDVYLEVLSGPEMGRQFPITGKTITIGRAASVDIRLRDEFVSNKHCQIVFRGDHFTVIDLESLNKTKVNGKAYLQKNLFHRDTLSLGKTELRFHWQDMTPEILRPEPDKPLPE